MLPCLGSVWVGTRADSRCCLLDCSSHSVPFQALSPSHLHSLPHTYTLSLTLTLSLTHYHTHLSPSPPHPPPTSIFLSLTHTHSQTQTLATQSLLSLSHTHNTYPQARHHTHRGRGAPPAPPQQRVRLCAPAALLPSSRFCRRGRPAADRPHTGWYYTTYLHMLRSTCW